MRRRKEASGKEMERWVNQIEFLKKQTKHEKKWKRTPEWLQRAQRASASRRVLISITIICSRRFEWMNCDNDSRGITDGWRKPGLTLIWKRFSEFGSILHWNRLLTLRWRRRSSAAISPFCVAIVNRRFIRIRWMRVCRAGSVCKCCHCCCCQRW